MSRRFTETNKWKDDWFLSLSNDSRIIWQYITDHCLISGMWKKEFKALNYFCGTNIDEDKCKEIFSGKFIEIKPEYFFIPSFLKEQYPNGLQLDSQKPMIISVFKEISFFNLTSIIKESLGNDYLMIKVKVKVNSKGKKKGVKGKAREFNFKSCLIKLGFDLNLINEWLLIRQNKNLTNTETALNGFIQQVELTKTPKNDILKICVEKSWGGFKAEWFNNLNNNNHVGNKNSRGSDAAIKPLTEKQRF